MSRQLRPITIWAPRVIGLAMTAFAALFALDTLDGRPVAEAVPAFVVHLIPAMILGLVVGISWKRPLIGAFGFGVLAAGYAAMVPGRPDWILIISGPMALAALLFAFSAAAASASGRAASR